MRRLGIFVSLVIFLVLFVLPSVAMGQPCPPVELNVSQEPPQQEWWMVLLDFLVQLSAPLVTAIIGLLGTWLVRKFGKKLDADKQATLIGLKDGLVTSGVAFAEEQARKALRNGESQTKSAEKLSLATDYIQEQLEQSGAGRMATESLVKLIEARLHMERSRPDGAVPSDVAPANESEEVDET